MGMAERTKRIRVTITADIDFAPGTENGFGGMKYFAKHCIGELEIYGVDVVGDGDDFYVTMVDVELTDQ